jgi:2-polyprenyl-3-methyl-5-hydroxy-6-metoxy-1,4-benzoquinol methylase
MPHSDVFRPMLTPDSTEMPSQYHPDLHSRCGHLEPEQRTLFTARDYISGDRFTVRLCRQCSLVRTSPAPEDAEKQRYYPPVYYGDARRYVIPVDFLLNRVRVRHSVQIHEANGNRPGTVLDIGCGRGIILDELRKLGWAVTGTELSDAAARFARAVLQLDVKVGDLRHLHFEEGAFDAVVLWHVLEHVDDPASLLREVHRLVRPGGFVLVAVPNFGSIEAKLTRASWFHLDVPRHVSHFTPETLVRMLEAEQFTSERINYFSLEYDYFSFVQSVLNRLGVHQNSLYELLRAGPAKLLQRKGTRGHARDTIANLILAPFLSLLALLFVPLAAWLGRGATLIVHARKV